MTIIAQTKVFTAVLPIDSTDCPIATRRHEILERIRELTATGCTVVNAAQQPAHIQGPPATAGVHDPGNWWNKSLMPQIHPHSIQPGETLGHDPCQSVCLIYAKDKPYAGKIRICIEYNQLYPDRPLALAAVGRILRWGIRPGVSKGATSRSVSDPPHQAALLKSCGHAASSPTRGGHQGLNMTIIDSIGMGQAGTGRDSYGVTSRGLARRGTGGVQARDGSELHGCHGSRAIAIRTFFSYI